MEDNWFKRLPLMNYGDIWIIIKKLKEYRGVGYTIFFEKCSCTNTKEPIYIQYITESKERIRDYYESAYLQ